MERHIIRPTAANDAEDILEEQLLYRQSKYGLQIHDTQVDMKAIQELVKGREAQTELRIYASEQVVANEIASGAIGFKKLRTIVNPAIAAPRAVAVISSTYRYKLRYLECFTTEDWSGPDEAYLKIKYTSPNGVSQSEQRGVYSLNDGQTKWIEDIFEYQEAEGIRITLYDEDSPDADDEIDSHKWHAIDSTWRYQAYRGDGAHYEIGYFGAS